MIDNDPLPRQSRSVRRDRGSIRIDRHEQEDGSALLDVAMRLVCGSPAVRIVVTP